MSKIIQVQKRVKEEFGITVQDYFNYLRLQYLERELTKDSHLGPYLRRVLGKEPEETIQAPGLDGVVDNWSDIDFHLDHRIKSIDELVNILDAVNEANKTNIEEQGYLVSILPLNIAIGNEDLLNKYFPKADFFTEHAAKSIDAYGIFSKGSIIEREGVYIGSQKFPRSLLMNIDAFCPMGCAGCYKGEYTRIRGSRFFTDKSKVLTQTELLVRYLNENPDIKSVIMSGGEPLMLSNQEIEQVLERLRRAKYLKELRICTGTIFQGLPYRIDNELLALLGNYEDETGVQVHFNAHLAHPAQFTPEALIAIRKIKKRGFTINSQIPLQRNVNIFLEEREKTMQTLYELTELQGGSGVRPYKYILHMNCGSLEYSVPLEYMLRVLGELKYRTDHPWPETWMPVSVSVLCKEGNILLSPQLVYGMEKHVAREQGYVEYKIPVPADKGFRTSIYREPLILGFNDDPNSLKAVKKV